MSQLFSISFLLTGVALAEAPKPGNEEDVTFQSPLTGEIFGTGVRRPTEEQWTWGEGHMVKTKKVKLNQLGLDRINHHRAEHGQQPLNDDEVEVAPSGKEIVGAAGSGSTMGGSSERVAGTPTYVDNSTLNFFPPIRNQGSLNSCAQFSTIYYTLTHMTAMARNLDAKNGDDSVRFSPKWTYNMLNGGANVGTSTYDAYAIAQKHGAATWADFPYDGDWLGWCMNPTAWRNAINMRADQTGKILSVNTDTGLNQLKQLLLNGYVLNFATYINSWQWNTIGNDPAITSDDAFAGKACAYMVNGSSGGHAMTIVGFNDDIWVDLNGDGLVTANEKGALRIANSWGTGWGEAGFCWVSYQALRTPNPAYASEGLFWYNEATWITARSTYQPKAIAQFTVNHPKRNQLQMTLGISDISATSPATTWAPNRILSYAGGAYAFDGSATACDATFCLDVSDLVPTSYTTKRYYLGLRDSTTGDLATLKSFTLIDVLSNTSLACGVLPVSADATLKYASLDDAVGTGTLTDSQPPTVSISSPSSGAQVSGTISISCASSDNVGVTAVTLYVDGIVQSTLSAAPYSFSWNSTAVADGTHTITVTAADAAGNSSQAAVSVIVKNTITVIDTIAPTISILSPASGTKIGAAAVKVQVDAKDNVAVTKVNLYVDNVLSASTTTAPFTMSLNGKKWSTGSHSLICVAYDAAGNTGASAAVSVTR